MYFLRTSPGDTRVQAIRSGRGYFWQTGPLKQDVFPEHCSSSQKRQGYFPDMGRTTRQSRYSRTTRKFPDRIPCIRFCCQTNCFQWLPRGISRTGKGEMPDFCCQFPGHCSSGQKKNTFISRTWSPTRVNAPIPIFPDNKKIPEQDIMHPLLSSGGLFPVVPERNFPDTPGRSARFPLPISRTPAWRNHDFPDIRQRIQSACFPDIYIFGALPGIFLSRTNPIAPFPDMKNMPHCTFPDMTRFSYQLFPDMTMFKADKTELYR